MQNAIEQMEKPSVPEESNKGLSHVDKFLHELPENMQDLFVTLRHSEEWSLARNIVGGVSGQNNKRQNELRKGVAGYLFEALSHLYLKEQLAQENRILLSPSETLAIYHELYPKRKVTFNRCGLQRSVEGITVPDGIILDWASKKRNKVMITGACEYSLNISYDKYEEEMLMRFLSLFKREIHQITGPITDESTVITDYIHGKYPHFPSNAKYDNTDAKLFIAPPVGFTLPFTDPEIKEIPMPVPTFVFRHFVDAFMADAQKVSPFESSRAKRESTKVPNSLIV